MNKLPDWADQLLIQVMKDEGRSKRPKISWGISKVNKGSSGHYSPSYNTIRVLAGTTGEDHRQVFLHEICHWLTKPRQKRIYFYGERRKKKNWHGKRFYTKLNSLLITYDCLTTQYVERENRYKKNSVLYLKV